MSNTFKLPLLTPKSTRKALICQVTVSERLIVNDISSESKVQGPPVFTFTFDGIGLWIRWGISRSIRFLRAVPGGAVPSPGLVSITFYQFGLYLVEPVGLSSCKVRWPRWSGIGQMVVPAAFKSVSLSNLQSPRCRLDGCGAP